MKTHEAIQRAVDGNTVIHAKELHLATSTVNKWQEPSTDFEDSGAFNPLDRLEKIIETSQKLSTPRKDALAPIYYLAQRFKCLLVPLPEVSPSIPNLHIQLARTVKEFGRLMESASESMDDGVITNTERQCIDRAGQHLQHDLALFLQLIAQAAAEK